MACLSRGKRSSVHGAKNVNVVNWPSTERSTDKLGRLIVLRYSGTG
jgi:hypothetical protein